MWSITNASNSYVLVQIILKNYTSMRDKSYSGSLHILSFAFQRSVTLVNNKALKVNKNDA